MGHVIRLHFIDFDLEESSFCNKDFVSVYDWKRKWKLAGRFCGRRYPEFVQSNGNRMLVRFTSNSNIQRTGFKAQYKAVKGRLRSRDGLIMR